jgi:hypothetical protein
MTGSPGLSRRGFCLAAGPALAATGLAGRSFAQVQRTRSPAASVIISSLSELAGAELIAGRPDSTVTGVALLASPTLAALREAAAARCSLILSPETPFYARPADPAASTGPFAAMAASAVAALYDSPAFKAKQAFIAEHSLTVYRLNPLTSPAHDISAEAIAARFGWTSHRIAGEHPTYAPPDMSVAALIGLAHARLGASGGLRFIGDPAMALRSILIVPGTAEVVSTTQALRNADALLTGDVREWEVVTYINDSAEAGLPKALVATGRILSEQPFVERCALAVRQAFPGLQVREVAEPDPFWRVQA